MIQRFMQSMAKTRGLCHPDCVKASSEQEDYGKWIKSCSREHYFIRIVKRYCDWF